MNKRLHTLLLSAILGLHGFMVVNAQPLLYVDEEGDPVSNDAADYAMAMTLFDSYRYVSAEAYKKNRAEALRRMETCASNGLAAAQFFLGDLYLNDTRVGNDARGIALLKKAAGQGNTSAMALLDARHVTYETRLVAQERPPLVNMSGKAILLLMIVQFGLAIAAHYKVVRSESMTMRRKKSNHYLIWLLPVLGPVMAVRNSGLLRIPLNAEDMNWIEGSMNWLVKEFKINPADCVAVTPSTGSIPVNFDYSEQSARDAVAFVSHRMNISRKVSIELQFFDQAEREIGNNIFTASYAGESKAAGLYFGKSRKGSYRVALERSQLNRPVNMIATLSHELAHIKLLGEGRMPINDEALTDLVTVVFGLGIFSANSAFQFSQQTDRWSYRRQGYLSEQMYGYALGYFAYLRNEDSPEWAAYLSPTIKEDFERSLLYLRNTRA